MKAFFSWLKKNADDAERASTTASAALCFAMLAGTCALLARAPQTEDEGASASEAAAPRISVRMADFSPTPEPPAEIENAPEETPPAPDVPAPEPTEPEPLPPEKIDDDAIRETLEETETPPREEEPPPEVPTPEPEPQKEPETPPQTETQKQSVPAPPEVDEAAEQARIAAEQSVYGMLADAIRRKKFYPKAARRTGRAGTVSLRVEIGGDGKIGAFAVCGGNAHKTLEDGALETLRRVAEDFRVPAEIPAELPAVFVVPVVYELN